MSSADQGNVHEDEDEDSETENSEVLQLRTSKVCNMVKSLYNMIS